MAGGAVGAQPPHHAGPRTSAGPELVSNVDPALDDGMHYELYSIMIHSGGAMGGHYYAYIKSFDDGKWYHFNDGSVSEITDDCIEKAFGGVSHSYSSYSSYSYSYSSAYSSSVSAYMLMYRRIESKRNCFSYNLENMPPSARSALARVKEDEEHRKQEEALKKQQINVTMVWQSPNMPAPIEQEGVFLKTSTIGEMKAAAYKTLKVEESGVPLERIRVRKVRGRVPDQPLGDEEKLSTVYWGYGLLTLMLEASRPDGTFEEYDPNGTLLEHHMYDATTNTSVKGNMSIPNQATLLDIKKKIAESAGAADPSRVLVVKTKNTTSWTSGVEQLVGDTRVAASEYYLYAGSKIGSCVVPEGVEMEVALKGLTDTFGRLVNTVMVTLVKLDDPDTPGKLIAVDQRMTLKEFKVEVVAPLVGLTDTQFRIFKPSYYYYDKTPIEVTALSDSMSMLFSYHPDKIFWQVGRALEEGQTALDIYLFDNRKGQPMVFDKIFDGAFTTNCNLGELRREAVAMLDEYRAANPEWKHKDRTYALENIRIRDVKRTQEGPGYVYVDDAMSLVLSNLSSPRQMCIQILDEPQLPITHQYMVIFLRRWHPDTLTLGGLEEAALQVGLAGQRREGTTMEAVVEAISQRSGIEVEHVGVARGAYMFPYDQSALKMLDARWDPPYATNSGQEMGLEHGCCIYYRDNRVPAKEISEEERAVLQKDDKAKVQKKKAATYYRKEKAITINSAAATSAEATPSPLPDPRTGSVSVTPADDKKDEKK